MYKRQLLLFMMSAALLIVLAKYMLSGDLVGGAFSINPGDGQPHVAGDIDIRCLVQTFTSVEDRMNQHYTVLTLLLLPLEALTFKLASGAPAD